MKFLVVCMFALVATSMAGVTETKEKRSLFELGNAGLVHGGLHTDIGHGYSGLSLDSGLLSDAHLSHVAPVTSLASFAPVVHAAEHTHTHSIEKVAVPYPVERTVVKHIPVPQPYPVHVKVPVPQPFPVPVEHVRTVAVERHVPRPYPVYIQREPTTIVKHIKHIHAPVSSW